VHSGPDRFRRGKIEVTSDGWRVTRNAAALFVSIMFLLLAARLDAGDAVAIGYNKDGIWTSVTYYSSGKPKGGRDYKTEAEAREEALRDLRKRGDHQTARTEILSSSDATGFAAVGRGADASAKMRTLSVEESRSAKRTKTRSPN